MHSSDVKHSSNVKVKRRVVLGVAACGSDSKSASPTTPTTPTTAAAGASTTAPSPASSASDATTPGSGSAPGSAPAGSAGCPTIDMSLDADHGSGSGRFESDLKCAAKAPLKAEGEPIVIGFQNAEGDPSGSFPEATLGAQAAVEYTNNELGGMGADIQNGKPGRPLKLESRSTPQPSCR